MSEIDDLRAEAERNKRAAQTLGGIVERQCMDVLDATGLHHFIDEDGDGDWGLVWEHLALLRPRLEAAEARLAAVEALVDEEAAKPYIGYQTVSLARLRAALATPAAEEQP